MSIEVCLITAGLPAPSGIAALLERCGVQVVTPADASDGHIYEYATGLVIDMPGDAGFRTLQLFRDYSINTPALLIVDPGLERAFEGVQCDWLPNVLPRTADLREVLRWVEGICRTKWSARRAATFEPHERTLMRA